MDYFLFNFSGVQFHYTMSQNLTIQLLEENISYDMAIEALKKLAESKFFDS